MGGGVSLPAVPLHTVHKRYLVAKYAAAEEAVADGELPSVLQRRASAWLEQHLPGVILFDQMDSDHGGSVDRDELRRFLCALPRRGAPPFEHALDALDGDGDGEITLDEWLANLAKLPALEQAIAAGLDEKGKIRGYASLETRLEEVTDETAALEKTLAKSADAAAAFAALPEETRVWLERRRGERARLEAAVGSVGSRVFRQIDRDGSGKIDRAELIGLLKALHKNTRRSGSLDDEGAGLSLDEILGRLDVDGDGLIDEDEWLANLGELPALQAYIGRYVDAATGYVRGLDEVRTPSPPPIARGVDPVS